jgi:hypothetical protein
MCESQDVQIRSRRNLKPNVDCNGWQLQRASASQENLSFFLYILVVKRDMALELKFSSTMIYENF